MIDTRVYLITKTQETFKHGVDAEEEGGRPKIEHSLPPDNIRGEPIILFRSPIPPPRSLHTLGCGVMATAAQRGQIMRQI